MKGTGTSIKSMDMEFTHMRRRVQATKDCGKQERKKVQVKLSMPITNSMVSVETYVFDYFLGSNKELLHMTIFRYYLKLYI